MANLECLLPWGHNGPWALWFPLQITCTVSQTSPCSHLRPVQQERHAQDVDSLSAATLLNSEEILDANNADCGDLIDGPQGRVALEQLRFVHQNQSIQGQVTAVW